MKKQEFDILNSLYNGSIGRAICSYDIETKNALADNETYRRMIKSGYICENDNSLTELGRNALENYRVNNAVILAAGASTRFIPLSLEQPKGLFEVKGEKLIESSLKDVIEMDNKIFSVLDEEEQNTLEQLLKKLVSF